MAIVRLREHRKDYILKYKNINVKQISISVCLGSEYKEKDFRENQELFKNMVAKLNFGYGFSYECPIEDLICVYPDFKSNEALCSLYGTFSEKFGEIKVNLLLDDFLEDQCNSIDLSLDEYQELLKSEC